MGARRLVNHLHVTTVHSTLQGIMPSHLSDDAGMAHGAAIGGGPGSALASQDGDRNSVGIE